MKRMLITLLAASAVLLPLPAVAQAPAPARPARHTQQACTEAAAVAVLRQDVTIDGVLAGQATAWSCASVAEAQQSLAAHVATVQLQAYCWYGRGSPPADGAACPPKP